MADENMLTDAQLTQLLARSAGGEGVMDILKSMGVNKYAGTDWLKKYHHERIVAAKKEQISKRKKEAPIIDPDATS